MRDIYYEYTLRMADKINALDRELQMLTSFHSPSRILHARPGYWQFRNNDPQVDNHSSELNNNRDMEESSNAGSDTESDSDTEADMDQDSNSGSSAGYLDTPGDIWTSSS